MQTRTQKMGLVFVQRQRLRMGREKQLTDIFSNKNH